MRRRGDNFDQENKDTPIRDNTLNEIINSHSFFLDLSNYRRRKPGFVCINNVETKIDEIDLKQLTNEQARDLKEIELLQ